MDLCNDSIGLHVNLGRSHTKLRHYSEARSHYETAIGLEPEYTRPQANLIRLLLLSQSIDEARAVWAQSSFADDDKERYLLEGEIETEAALVSQVAEDKAACEAHAQRALEAFASAGEQASSNSRHQIAQALIRGDDEGVFIALAAGFQKNPTMGERLRILVHWMSDDLSPSETAALNASLSSLAKSAR